MDELVAFLSDGMHPVVSRRAKSAEEIKESIDRGYVLLTFTDTRGGTELGVRLDDKYTDLSQADFQAGSGVINLGGDLSLNYTKVRCLVELDLASMKGEGRLEVLEEAEP